MSYKINICVESQETAEKICKLCDEQKITYEIMTIKERPAPKPEIWFTKRQLIFRLYGKENEYVSNDVLWGESSLYRVNSKSEREADKISYYNIQKTLYSVKHYLKVYVNGMGLDFLTAEAIARNYVDEMLSIGHGRFQKENIDVMNARLK